MGLRFDSESTRFHVFIPRLGISRTDSGKVITNLLINRLTLFFVRKVNGNARYKLNNHGVGLNRRRYRWWVLAWEGARAH